MSWSVSATGTKEAVRAAAESQFDNAERNYAGTEEGKDVAAARARTLSMIDELDMTPTDVSPSPIASVSCYGSRSTADGKLRSASVSIGVSRSG